MLCDIESAIVPGMRKAGSLVLIGMAWIATAGYAGPPFQTDDPDPVEYRHFEMYAFELADGTGRNAGGSLVEVPGYEVNYGAAPNLQLHLVFTPAANFSPAGGPVYYGLADTEIGFKYRFIKESRWFPETGIFPFVELPSGSAQKGLGVGRTWYRLPLWFQKSWGAEGHQWTTYGGGGETIVPQEGYVDFPFAGWLVQRQVSKRLTLGGELFGHGAEGPAATASSAAIMADVGGIFEFKDGFDLLFAGGRSVHGEPETYVYLSLYWTWGPKGNGGADSGENSGESTEKMFSSMNRLVLR